ncbi:MAG: hypothetical protein P1U42_07640 [Phycisphaerales bacterium]|nr:hypothetical protein [Phycisphaerales bacterium]
MTITKEINTSSDPKSDNRTIYWVLVVVSIFVIVISGFALAKRIGQYYDSFEHPLFAYVPIASTSFTFADKPITIVEETIDDKPFLHIKYGTEALLLEVVIPPQQPLPSLFDRQKDWFTMVFFADRSGITLSEFTEGISADEIKPRLGIVTRTPFGVEPAKEPRFENLQQPENASSGDVRRDRWRFDCYELNRDGTITHEVKRFPEDGRSLLRRQNYAKLKGENIPERGDGELEEYTWEYGAAHKVMPRAPAITFEKQALRGAGWTLPTAAAGFLVLVVSFFFAIAPTRRV